MSVQWNTTILPIWNFYKLLLFWSVYPKFQWKRMSRTQNSINVYVPPVSSFPEPSLLGGYDLQDRMELPKPAEVLEDVPDDREPHFLYVIDSRGRLLEHIRYYGDDYRMALREAFTTKLLDHSENNADFGMGPGTHRKLQTEDPSQFQQ